MSGGRLEGRFFSFEVGMGAEGGSAWANFVGCLLGVVRHQKSGRGWTDDGWTDACEVKPGRSASSDAENPSWGVAGTRRQGRAKRFVSIVGRFCFPPPPQALFLCRGGLALDDPSLVAGWLSCRFVGLGSSHPTSCRFRVCGYPSMMCLAHPSSFWPWSSPTPSPICRVTTREQQKQLERGPRSGWGAGFPLAVQQALVALSFKDWSVLWRVELRTLMDRRRRVNISCCCCCCGDRRPSS